MITHSDDGVALFGPEIFLRAPEWLGPADTRPTRVPQGMRWVPTTTFFQGLVDMKNSATVVPGQFDAKGHDYRLDLVPFFNAVLGFDESPERVERIIARLETQELNRTRWIASHTAAGIEPRRRRGDPVDGGRASRRVATRTPRSRRRCARSSTRCRTPSPTSRRSLPSHGPLRVARPGSGTLVDGEGE